MRLLIKRAVIIDAASPHHKKKVDLYIRNGKIEKIGRALKVDADEIVESGDLHVSPGWCDIGTQVGEPGLEHREDLSSASLAAAMGGYTAIACFPNTHPAIDSKSQVEYILSRSRNLPISVYPIGALTTGATGNDIAEMHDMHNSGALAFSNGRNPMDNSGVMLLSLQYVRSFDGVVINRPVDLRLSPGGQINESEVSASMGLRGIPNMSEQLMLERDVHLLEYAGSRLHVYGISTREAVQLVKDARKEGLAISCSTPVANLVFTDRDLRDFNSNLKVMPPLRSSIDRSALVRGIRDGAIQCIVSNHEPLEEELKKLEFARADFGMISLQTAFSAAHTAVSDTIDLEDLVKCFSIGPRAVLGLAAATIEEGAKADLTLFDPSASWTFTRSNNASRSYNSPFIGTAFTGKVVGIFCKGKLHLNEMN